jgi:Zn-finger nucleic acid-binding protein
MKCPIDGRPLETNHRSGVEINHCPQCRGVWLDRGELEKIIRNTEVSASTSPEGDYDEDGYHPTPSKKRRGFLGALFDF